MKRIVIIGNYGAGNVGDDYLLLGTLNLLKRTYSDRAKLEITVLRASKHHITTEKQVFAELPNLWQLSFLPLLPTGVRSWLKGLVLRSTKRAKEAMANADLIIFGGGGLFNSEVLRSLEIWGKQLRFALDTKAKVAVLGQSFLKLPTSLIEKLQQVDILTVRDSYSARICTKAGLNSHNVADLSLLTNMPVHGTAREIRAPYVCLSFRNYVTMKPETVLDAGREIVEALVEDSDLQVCLIDLDQSDKDVLHALYKSLPGDCQERCWFAGKGYTNIDLKSYGGYIRELIRNSNGICSMRLHGGILGYLEGKPVLPLVYQRKVSAFWQQVLPCLQIKRDVTKTNVWQEWFHTVAHAKTTDNVHLSMLTKKAMSQSEYILSL